MAIERCKRHCVLAARPRPQALARLVLELRELGLDLGRRRPSSARRRNIADRSWRTSTSRQPSADVMPGFGGTSTVGIDSSLRQRRAVQRAGAAERDERELARVVAAADRDQPHGVGHVGVRDAR